MAKEGRKTGGLVFASIGVSFRFRFLFNIYLRVAWNKLIGMKQRGNGTR